MYDMNEYATAEQRRQPRPARRNWLALAIGLAAVLVLVVLVAMACSARSGASRTPLGAVATPTASAEADGTGSGGQAGVGSSGTSTDQGGNDGGGNDGGGNNDGGNNDGGSNDGGGNDGGGNDGGGNDDSGNDDSGNDGDGGEPELEPLSITATINTVAPGGQCFASGTIEVGGGGDYPVTVYYQWRRVGLDHNGQLTTLPVSAVQNMTFDEPGERKVQTSQLPEDGPNVRIFVTGPKKVNSDWVAYESCGNTQPGDIAP